MDFVRQLKPVQFNWKDRNTNIIRDSKPRYGFLAQDILEIENLPRVLVDDEDPENLKLRESMLMPVMVQAIKDLSVEVESLKLQVEALTNK